MDAGRLNKRVKVLRLTKTADGFGGFTSSETIVHTLWCKLKEVSGNVTQENGIREQRNEIELMLRQKAANQILMSDVLQLESSDEKFRINDKFDSTIDQYTTIKAVGI